MKKLSWLLAFLSLMIPSGADAQIQDIHALRIVAQSFERAKKDNKTRQDTVISQKIHRIENLNANSNFESIEKVATFKVYMRDGKPLEKLISIWPPRTKPAPNPVDFDKLLDAFLSRFYFLLSPDKEVVDSRRCLKIHFWPKENLPLEKNYSDYIINRISGIIYIDEKTYMIGEVDGSLNQNIDENEIVGSFFMDRFNLKIKFREWRGLGLPQTITATVKYRYRKVFFITRRFQTHTFLYEYGIE